MIRRRGLLAGMAAVGAFALSSCSTHYPDIRYRLTVYVDTPEGVRSGFSVIEVRMRTGAKFLGSMGGRHRELTGEAVAVDLGARGVLFALLRSGGDVEWAQHMPFMLDAVAALEFSPGVTWEDGLRAQVARFKQITTPIELPRATELQRNNAFDEQYRPKVETGTPFYPLLVRFKDINDPKSVERVDPDVLEKSFGRGVKLKRITVQATDEPVTTGIEKRLPKRSEKGFFNWDERSNPNNAGVYGIWDFVRGASE